MNPNNLVVNQSWEDLVFENRNKEYGAYIVRKSYTKHVILSLLFAVLIIGLGLAFPTIVKWLTPVEIKDPIPIRTISINDLDAPPPIKEQPPPPKLEIPPPVKTIIKFLPPKVTEKEIVEEEPMPTQEELKQNETGSENVEGTGEVVFEEPVEEVIDKGSGDEIFTVVEQSPEFEGGYEAMIKFINKNTKYPAKARRMGIEGTVFIQFVVDKEGKISDTQVIRGIDSDCDKEALRVVGIMPAWKPGKQNGHAVKVRFVLPIKFKLDI